MAGELVDGALRGLPLRGADLRATRRMVLILAWPAVGEMFLHTFVWVADTAMVGRLGAEAISAVGMGGEMYFSIIAALGALGVGTTALVARHVGAGEERPARFAAAQGLVVACACGAGMALLGLVLGPWAFSLTGLGRHVQAMGGVYLRIMCSGAGFVLATWVINGAFRATGDTRTPLLVTGVTNALNVIGDYALIYGHFGLPAMGVAGAAVGSVIAQGIGLLIAASRLLSERTALRPGPGWTMVPDRRAVVRLLRVSAPAGIESLLTDGARMIGLFIVAATGPVAFAAVPITIAAEAVSFMAGHGFAIAAGIIAGQRLGAGRPDRAYRESAVAVRLAALMMAALGLAFIAFPAPLVRLFTTDPAVLALAAPCLRITGFFQVAVAIADTFLGALRGAGETRVPMAITGVAAWAVRLPFCFLALRVLGLPVPFYFWAAGLEWTAKAVLAVWAFRRGRWLKRTV